MNQQPEEGKASVKNIKDYLHLYLGCKAVTVKDKPEIITGHIIDLVNGNFYHAKPILRPLSDMTDVEFLSIFKMSIGCYEDMNVSEFKRWSSSDLYVRLGYGQFIFGYVKHPKPDVRVDEGISFFIKEYLIEDRIELTDKGLTETKSHFNKENLVIAFNQSAIFNKLRKDSFDVDGLIESGLAIEKPKNHV